MTNETIMTMILPADNKPELNDKLNIVGDSLSEFLTEQKINARGSWGKVNRSGESLVQYYFDGNLLCEFTEREFINSNNEKLISKVKSSFK